MENEVETYEKEIKMLNTLQKQYTFELIDYLKLRQSVEYRKTFMGKLGYRLGKVVAVFWIIRFT